MRLAPTPRPPRLNRSGLVLLLYGALLLVAVGIGALAGRPNVFRWSKAGALDPAAHGAGALHLATGLGLWLGLAVLVALGAVFLSRWSAHRFEWARTLEREFRAILGPLSEGEVLVLAAASSVGEEALFRGALAPMLGIYASSLLFALPHVGPGRGVGVLLRFLPWTLSAFVAGLVFGELFAWSGNLAAPVCAHFLINLINLRHITRTRR